MGNSKTVIQEQVDAKKSSISAQELAAVFPEITEIHATKGKKVISMAVAPGSMGTPAVQELIIGPSGNLRAPAIRKGNKLIVGFDPALFTAQVLGE